MSIRLLIVEDDPVALTSLARVCMATGLVRTLWEAETGAKGLALLLSERPDLVLTDIRMPDMGGLEMLRALQQADVGEYRPDIVIISAYDTFAYAQQALRLGAKDYLLKPFRQADIERVLRLGAEEPGLTGLSPVPPALLKNWLASPTHYAREVATLCGSRVSAYGQTLLVDARQHPSANYTAHREDIGKALLSLLIPLVGGAVAVFDQGAFAPQLLCALLYPAEGMELSSGQIDRLDAGIRRMETQYQVGLRGALSGVFGHWFESVHIASQQAGSLLALSFYEPDAAVITQTRAQQDAKHALPIGLRQALFDALHVADAQRMRAAVFALREEAEIKPHIPPHNLIFTLHTWLLALIHDAATALDEAQVGALEAQCQAIFTAPQACSALFAALDAALCELCERVLQNRDRGASIAMSRCVEYIHAHHADLELTQDATARRLGLTPSYFGVLFKRHVGASFTQYLNHRRVDAAKALLTDTDESVHAVARRAGYRDSRYFARVFKATTGLSPQAYRLQNKGGRMRDEPQ